MNLAECGRYDTWNLIWSSLKHTHGAMDQLEHQHQQIYLGDDVNYAICLHPAGDDLAIDFLLIAPTPPTKQSHQAHHLLALSR